MELMDYLNMGDTFVPPDLGSPSVGQSGAVPTSYDYLDLGTSAGPASSVPIDFGRMKVYEGTAVDRGAVEGIDLLGGDISTPYTDWYIGTSVSAGDVIGQGPEGTGIPGGIFSPGDRTGIPGVEYQYKIEQAPWWTILPHALDSSANVISAIGGRSTYQGQAVHSYSGLPGQAMSANMTSFPGNPQQTTAPPSQSQPGFDPRQILGPVGNEFMGLVRVALPWILIAFGIMLVLKIFRKLV